MTENISTQTQKNALSVDGLHVSAAKEVVRGVSFQVHAGDLVIIMGPNGSGKTTLVSALMGHPAYDVSSGTITLDGRDITHEPPDVRARAGLFLSMQYIPEIEGVSLASFLYRSHKAHTGADMSVPDFRKLLTREAETLGAPASFLDRDLNVRMSGGEKKLSEMLQLAVLAPRYALLDEIDSGVDVDAQKKVFAGIARAREKGTGVVLITHYTSILEHVEPTAVHIMAAGRIVRSGGAELIREVSEVGYGPMAALFQDNTPS